MIDYANYTKLDWVQNFALYFFTLVPNLTFLRNSVTNTPFDFYYNATAIMTLRNAIMRCLQRLNTNGSACVAVRASTPILIPVTFGDLFLFHN